MDDFLDARRKGRGERAPEVGWEGGGVEGCEEGGEEVGWFRIGVG